VDEPYAEDWLADDDEPFDPYFDIALEEQPGGAAWIATHNAAVRDAPQRPTLVEATQQQEAARPSARVWLMPRDARDVEARRGRILRQRVRLTPTAFSTDDALRVFLAERSSLDFEELVRPTPAGHLTTHERSRRDELARVVSLARAEGAGFEPLARVLGRSLSTVHALAQSKAA
jgi:hypothetical protein